MGSSVVRPGDWVAPHLSGRATADLSLRGEVVAVGVPGTQDVSVQRDRVTGMCLQKILQKMSVLNASLLGVMGGFGSPHLYPPFFSHLQSPPLPSLKHFVPLKH